MTRSGSFLAILVFVTTGVLYAADPVPPGVPAGPLPALTLSFVGDIMQHERNAQMPDYDRLYDSVRTLLSVDDLSFGNIEFPVDPVRPSSGYPLFNATPDYVAAAIHAGFDVFSLANNHSFDQGQRGVHATRAVFAGFAADSPIATSGLRASAGAPLAPTLITRRGWRIGFVAITAFSNVSGSAPWINLVDYTRDAERSRFLDLVRSWQTMYDLLIVSVHAGVEYSLTPSADKVSFLRAIAGAGADIVWSHHPHVLQPWEMHDGSLIITSAGNFVSGQRRHQSPDRPFGFWAPTGDTVIYQVRVAAGPNRATVEAVRTPVFTTYDDPRYGLVLRTFPEVFAADLTPRWRAFYLARFAVMQRYAPRAAQVLVALE